MNDGTLDLGKREKRNSGPDAENDVDTLPSTPYHDAQKQHEDRRAHIPWRYKLIAASMILLFAFGSSFSESTFGPLKSTLVEELSITSTSPAFVGPGNRHTLTKPLRIDAQYGAISSASSLVNTILPIVGGIYMDHVRAHVTLVDLLG